MLRTTYENNKKELDMIRYGTLEGNEKDIKNAGIEELENTINNYIKRIKNLEHKKNEIKLRKENLDKSANQEFLYLDDQINRCKTYIMNLKKQLYGYNSEYIRKRVIEEELIVVMSYQRKNKVDREIEEMQLLTKPFIVSKKKANLEKLKEINCWELFNNIEMPLIKVLGEMQYNGIHLDENELTMFGNELKAKIGELKKEIYEMCGQEFNVNSTQQLGKVLFEDLKLPVYKKTKSGYSTDVDVLEKLKKEHPVIEKILEYRTLMKLNSTYVEGLLPYVNSKTKRIHSYFHQTITATGRISSTEPNLQNIPTRIELGKQLRKAFKPEKGYIYIDADYSQIELRVLAHISQDENMINAFENDEDIHRQVASKVFDVPMEEVTKEQRSAAKAESSDCGD